MSVVRSPWSVVRYPLARGGKYSPLLLGRGWTATALCPAGAGRVRGVFSLVQNLCLRPPQLNSSAVLVTMLLARPAGLLFLVRVIQQDLSF